MKNNPRVSIVMSVYSEPLNWLRDSIDSILVQTVSDFEFIIVCDNPQNSNVINLLHEYANNDKRIHLVFNEENIGLTKSLNKGLAIAKGEYIARMDADDISRPDRLEKQVLFLDNHRERSMCHTAYETMDNNRNFIKDIVLSDFTSDKYELFIRDMIAHPTVMFRADLLTLRYPFYNESYICAQDYELWSFLLLNDTQIGYINDICLSYRISSSQISSKKSSIQKKSGQEIRRNLICKYLANKNIPNVNFSKINEIIWAINKNPFNSNEDKRAVLYLKYILYYNCVRNNPINLLFFIFDKDLLMFKLPLFMTRHILLSFIFKNRWQKFVL